MFVREFLERDSLFALRANRESISKVDSNGDLLVRIESLLQEKPLPVQGDLMKPRNFRQWLIQAFGVAPDYIARILQIIRANRPLRDAMIDYCKTSYGAANFKITWAAKVVLSGLDFVSRILILI